MERIDVDFEVYKRLTMRRTSEQVTYNEVIRDLLGLKRSAARGGEPRSNPSADWTSKGVRFPVGTEFRADYKGREVLGHVDASTLVVNGKRFTSPSAAAMSVTDCPVNGWVFWQCRFPGQSTWKQIKALRGL